MSRFNLFLALAFLAASLCGCSSLMGSGHKDDALATLHVHISLAPDSVTGPMSDAETVSVLRADPMQWTIQKEPILTEANIVAAKVISTPDAPAIEIRFDDNGTWILEQYSAANPGGHFVIFGQWGKKGKKQSDARWLAAPIITHRINNGILSFTPDMTRDEANQLVQGLNNAAKEFQTTPME